MESIIRSMDYLIRDVTDVDKPQILAFSQQYPWKPSYPASLVNRFLNELTSTNHLIFDLHDGDGRIASAVLIDKVSNPSNDACLEVVGICSRIDPILAIAKFVGLSRTRCPKHRSGFQFGVAEDSPINDEFLEKNGFYNHYSTYEMENPSIIKTPTTRENKISFATKDTSAIVYKVLCESFGKNPDTSIPDAETWNSTFLRSNRSHYYLWFEENQLVGFANLVEPDSGNSAEVRTIGVLPVHRGSGIGRELLHHCLNETIRLGYGKCHLTVAVENDKALGLYLRSGFRVSEKHKCYRTDLR